MCCGCLKEPSHRDGSFEYTQHMFWLRNKKNNFLLSTLIWWTANHLSKIQIKHEGPESLTWILSPTFVTQIEIIWFLSSADNLCKQFGPRPGLTKCWSWSRSKCRTKHPRTKHPMPYFDTSDKTSHKDLPPRTKHPMLFLSPWTKHPMPFLSPWTKHPMPFLPPWTKHPTFCLKHMKVHKISQFANCYYYWYS